MKKLFILFLSALVLSCSSVKTVVNYDEKVDFTEFKSYGFTEDDLEAAIGQNYRSTILSAVEKGLIAKGLSKSDDPDLLVNVHIKTQQVVEPNAASQVGYGSYGLTTANSGAYAKYDKYTEGSMFIIMADNDTKIIIWQGVGTKIVDESATGEEREENLTKIVQGIISKYPYDK